MIVLDMPQRVKNIEAQGRMRKSAEVFLQRWKGKMRIPAALSCVQNNLNSSFTESQHWFPKHF